MCQYTVHYLLKKKLCICLTVYLVFGLRVNCSLVGHQSHSFPPAKHLEALFKNITDQDAITSKNLTDFLSQMKLTSHAHEEKEGVEDSHEHSHSVGEEHSHKHTADCYSAKQMLGFFGPSAELNKSQFMSLLPTIVYEIHTDACHSEHVHHHHSSNTRDWKAILASVIAVIVVGSTGLTVVILVPLMSRSFYHVVTQFLIALSVGSLTGDAFLHLIPHALTGGHSHDPHDHHIGESEEHNHREMVLKALVSLLGIYAFFVTERLTILCQNKVSRNKMKRQRAQAAHMLDDGMSGEKALSHQPVPVQAHYRNGYLHSDKNDGSKSGDQIRTETADIGECGMLKAKTHDVTVPDGICATYIDDITKPLSHIDSQLCNRPPERPMDNTRCEDYLKDDMCFRGHSGTFGPAGGVAHYWPLTSSTNIGISGTRPEELDGTTVKKTTTLPVIGMTSTSENGVTADAAVWQKQNNSAVYHVDDAEQQPTHPHRDKPHGHHHGHSHDLSSVRAIAYTVLAGDGLHNFCDGIAIGSAFAADLRGGLSTSIAVLCHELPHELGDFAVLLHAGMSVKSAFFYNLLSGLLCAVGTAIGLVLGRLDAINSWLFMLTAGMFVYIALVDMMPELSTNRLKGHRYCHQPAVLFLWQNLGILLGYLVMFLIALFEDHMV